VRGVYFHFYLAPLQSPSRLHTKAPSLCHLPAEVKEKEGRGHTLYLSCYFAQSEIRGRGVCVVWGEKTRRSISACVLLDLPEKTLVGGIVTSPPQYLIANDGGGEKGREKERGRAYHVVGDGGHRCDGRRAEEEASAYLAISLCLSGREGWRVKERKRAKKTNEEEEI